MANFYASEYLRHLNDLNVLPADGYPRVSSEMPEIIRIIQELGESGHAYEVDGDVYFRVEKDDDYGKLSRRNIQEAMSGTRLEEDENKENQADFASAFWHRSGAACTHGTQRSYGSRDTSAILMDVR